jgi:hypothetical protein
LAISPLLNRGFSLGFASAYTTPQRFSLSTGSEMERPAGNIKIGAVDEVVPESKGDSPLL